MKLSLSSAPKTQCDFSDFIFETNYAFHSEHNTEKDYCETVGYKKYNIEISEVPDQRMISKEEINNFSFPWNYKEQCLKAAENCGGISLVGDIFGYNWVQINYTGGCDLFLTDNKWKEIPYTIIGIDEFYNSAISKRNETP